jgi:hypothetical protein
MEIASSAFSCGCKIINGVEMYNLSCKQRWLHPTYAGYLRDEFERVAVAAQKKGLGWQKAGDSLRKP